MTVDEIININFHQGTLPEGDGTVDLLVLTSLD